MAILVDFTIQGNIGVITVHNPPVNALSIGVPEQIIEYLELGSNNPEIAAFILMGGGSTFIAGADIRELGKPKPAGAVTLHELLPVLEECKKPVVAAIHGTALGGGLEVALACHFRCAVASAKLGLPEVKLGLLPGGGGTQRLPRLIGVEPALKLMLSGDHIDTQKALELGLIDDILNGELLSASVSFATRIVSECLPLRKISRMNAVLKTENAADFFITVREDLKKTCRGYLSPFLIVDCVEAACSLPFADGRIKERELFRQCVESRQSNGLRHVFFAEREAGKIPDIPKDTPVVLLRRAGVIGAGIMGRSIAINFVDSGIPVFLIEKSQELLDNALRIIHDNYAYLVSTGRLSQVIMDKRLELICGSVTPDILKSVDVVVETVSENIAIKQKLFQVLDRICSPTTILATTTSTLDINEIAAVTARPERIIGLHFLNHLEGVRLLEVVRTVSSSNETVAASMTLAKKLNKIGVVVRMCDGFVCNRMFAAFTRAVHDILNEGALLQQVDRVLYDFGFAMDTRTMAEIASFEINLATNNRREVGDREIIERCLFAQINEAATILEEGVALRAGDIDLVSIHGYGFPAYHGGILFYAESNGLSNGASATWSLR